MVCASRGARLNWNHTGRSMASTFSFFSKEPWEITPASTPPTPADNKHSTMSSQPNNQDRVGLILQYKFPQQRQSESENKLNVLKTKPTCKKKRCVDACKSQNCFSLSGRCSWRLTSTKGSMRVEQSTDSSHTPVLRLYTACIDGFTKGITQAAQWQIHEQSR